MNRDLTIGDSGKVLRRFCLPLFESVIFQQLYNIADSLVAGRFIGENALAAVGNSYEITLIFIAIAFGCNIGCSVVVSTYFGAKRYAHVKTAVSTAMIGMIFLCGALMAAGLLLGGVLLSLMHTPETLFADSKLYLDIYVLGLPFVFFYNVAVGIFSAMGDSMTPFIFLAVSSTSNIAVDILFVRAFHMGVAGVAWATFLCQGVSCVLALVFVFRRLGTLGHGHHHYARFSGKMLKRIASIAVPSMMQQSFVSIGNIIIQSRINTFGPSVMAGYSAAIKLNNLVITSHVTIGNGISNFTAQNLGAGKLGRIREGFRAGVKLEWLGSLPFFVLYFFLGGILLQLFLDGSATEAIRTGVLFFHIVTPFYFVVAAKCAADGTLRGSAKMKPFLAATFTDLLLRVALAILFSFTPLQETGIWCAWPVGWIIAAIMSVSFYRRFARDGWL